MVQNVKIFVKNVWILGSQVRTFIIPGQSDVYTMPNTCLIKLQDIKRSVTIDHLTWWWCHIAEHVLVSAYIQLFPGSNQGSQIRATRTGATTIVLLFIVLG